MFGIDSSEFLLIAFVALIVIGPKDLPKAMRIVGYWVGKARGVGRQFRQGFDSMIREAELEEMEKRWATENERIMREHPATSSAEVEAPTVHVEPPVQVEAPIPIEPPVHVELPVHVDAPIHVEQPVVVAAPAAAPALRADGAPS